VGLLALSRPLAAAVPQLAISRKQISGVRQDHDGKVGLFAEANRRGKIRVMQPWRAVTAFVFLVIGGGPFVHEAHAQDRSRILVLISADAEWGPTKEALRPKTIGRSPYGEFFTSRIAGEPVLFLHGGWGKIAAAASTEYAISRWRPQIVIVLGTCGGIEGRVDRYERLLVTRTVVYDIEEAMGDSAEAIAAYTSEIDLGWLDDEFPLQVRRVPMLSGDRDLVPAGVPALTRRFSAVAADWESGAIARVATLRHARLLILKAVSDLVSANVGEAVGNRPLFEQQAAISMRLLLGDLRTLVPYVVSRLTTQARHPRR